MSVQRNYIAGHWQAAKKTFVNENPSDLSDPVGTFAYADQSDTLEAVAAAKEAFASWSLTTPGERAQVLQRAASELAARKQELGTLLAREEGKTLAEGIGEVQRAADIFSYYAAETYRATGELIPSSRPGVEIEVRRLPVGVVGVITPWNFPIAIPAWKIAPALAYGNTVVFKPAELAPACAWELVSILERAGLPGGVLNLVMGSGSVVGEAIITHPDVAAVTFTGSNGIGQRVAAAAAQNFTKVQLELGGKNAIVVLDDANLARAANHAVNGAFFSTGQRCTASSRIIVTAKVYEEFVDLLAASTRAIRVGNALAPDTDVGPVVDAKQLAKNLEYIGVGKAEGATALVEGTQLELAARGHYLSPTLFVDTRPDMRINKEEIFGPVASVIRVADYDEAIAVTNDSSHGLVASLHTGSLAHAAHFKRHAAVGMSMINLPTVGQEYQAPFGGSRGSSYGPREQGTSAKEFFTEVRTSYVAAE